MNEIMGFTQRLFEHHDAAIEHRDDRLEALLPAPLAEALGLPELVVFSDGAEGTPLGYGTEVLERLLALATASIPCASARFEARELSLGVAERAASAFALRNGVFSILDLRRGSGLRLWLHALFDLASDEQRLGLTGATVSLASGAPVEGFSTAVYRDLGPWTDLGAPLHTLRRGLDAAMRQCEARTDVVFEHFSARMTRRRDRDKARIESYFADLEGELGRRARRLSAEAMDAKRAAIARDRDSKLESLGPRYTVRRSLRPVAALLIESPIVLIDLDLRRRKARRTVCLEYDVATRQLVAPACEACGLDAPSPVACDDAVHLLCHRCVPTAKGRPHCLACQRT